MALRPDIIMSGRQPNIVNALRGGAEAAAMQNQVMRQNRLAEFYDQQGAALVQGDQGAINAYARMDPQGAMGMKDTQERLKMARAQGRRQAEQYAMQMDAAEAAAQAEQLKRAIAGGLQAQTPEQWDQFVASMGADNLVGQFENRELIASQYLGIADALEQAAGPGSAKPGNDYERYVARETAAGRQPMDEFAYRRAIEATKGDGMAFRQTLPDGSVVEWGSRGLPDRQDVSVGDVYNPGEVNATVSLIDEILDSPALDRITGAVEGGGGNDIDEFNMVQRAYYGSEGLSTIEKINQLQSRSWLAARAMLKGGGPITDYESRKAEAAVARLSRAKDKPEFEAALNDLRDAITEGMAKLEAANRGGNQSGGTTTGSTGGGTATGGKFDNMSLEQLRQNLPQTEEEAAEWNRRWDALQ